MPDRKLHCAASLLAIVLIALSQSQATQSVYCITGVNLTAEPVHSSFLQSESAVLLVTITNNTHSDISYDPESFPFGAELDKADAKGCWQMLVGNMPARGKPKRKLPRTEADYAILRPDENHSQRVDITPLMHSKGNVWLLQDGKHCSVVSAAEKPTARRDFYRVRFWDDGIKAPNVRHDRTIDTCATHQAVAVFSVEK